MNAQRPSNAKVSSRLWWTGTRRAALILLLAGWSAFWIGSAARHCCQLAATQAHANVAHANFAGAHASDHEHGDQPADPGNDCGTIPVVTLAALAVASPASSGDRAANAVYAGLFPPAPIAPRAARTAATHPPPPPRAVAAFHLRTSRILI